MTRHLDANWTELVAMLGYKRPAYSNAEQAFVDRFLAPLGATPDAFGNMVLRIGHAPVLWSSHTDTVHSKPGPQRVVIDGTTISAPRGSNCLGADCTAGVWLMVEMIRANVPGLYVFHRAEEVGGHGSSYIAKDTPGLLDGIKYAVAFDRRGTSSIITHQAGGRCCSDAFARSLRSQLGPVWRLDEGGSFTDTANYMDLVPECTNLSIGYANEHTSRETLDVQHLMEMRDAMLNVDVEALTCSRDPSVVDDWEADAELTRWFTTRRDAGRDQLYDLVLEHPEAVADLLDQYGITAKDILGAAYGPAWSDDASRMSGRDDWSF